MAGQQLLDRLYLKMRENHALRRLDIIAAEAQGYTRVLDAKGAEHWIFDGQKAK